MSSTSILAYSFRNIDFMNLQIIPMIYFFNIPFGLGSMILVVL